MKLNIYIFFMIIKVCVWEKEQLEYYNITSHIISKTILDLVNHITFVKF